MHWFTSKQTALKPFERALSESALGLVPAFLGWCWWNATETRCVVETLIFFTLSGRSRSHRFEVTSCSSCARASHPVAHLVDLTTIWRYLRYCGISALNVSDFICSRTSGVLPTIVAIVKIWHLHPALRRVHDGAVESDALLVDGMLPQDRPQLRLLDLEAVGKGYHTMTLTMRQWPNVARVLQRKMSLLMVKDRKWLCWWFFGPNMSKPSFCHFLGLVTRHSLFPVYSHKRPLPKSLAWHVQICSVQGHIRRLLHLWKHHI